MRLLNWLIGWKETFMIWAFSRETYRTLTRPIDPEDFVEVERPQ